MSHLEYQLRGKQGVRKKVRPVVMIIRSHDEKGRPRYLEACYDEQTVNVSDPFNREMLVAFVETHMAEPNPSKAEYPV